MNRSENGKKTMEYVERLRKEPSFARRLERLAQLEEGRAYCGHDLNHFLSTARIAWILCLESGLSMDKEQIYLCALLHDLGRVEEYQERISHDEASAAFAGEILCHIGYDERKTGEICAAIASHRKRRKLWENGTFTEQNFMERRPGSLAELLALADQLSRNCYLCPVSGSCKWAEEEKTGGIII